MPHPIVQLCRLPAAAFPGPSRWLLLIALTLFASKSYAQNIIPDPSFEAGTANWDLKDANSSIDNSVARTGSRSLKLVNDGSSTNHNAIQEQISGVQAGTEYEYSVWVQGDNLTGEGGGGKPLAVVRWRDSGGTKIEKEMYMWAPYGSYGWRKLNIYLQAPANAAQVDISFRSWYGCLTGVSHWDDTDLSPRDLSYRGSLLATYQAEDANSTSGGAVAATETNYTGSGYFAPSADGSYVQWNAVAGGAGGARILSFRYTLEGNAKPWEVLVNGTSQGPVTPLATGRINSWASFDWEVTLAPGDNTIRVIFKQVTAGPLLDRLDVFQTAGSQPPAVAKPTISPDGGTFSSPVEVSLQTTTAGATIYYTTDGSAPSRSSTQYSGPFTLSTDTALKAFAVAPDKSDSEVASASFSFTAASDGAPLDQGGDLRATDTNELTDAKNASDLCSDCEPGAEAGLTPRQDLDGGCGCQVSDQPTSALVLLLGLFLLWKRGRA